MMLKVRIIAKRSWRCQIICSAMRGEVELHYLVYRQRNKIAKRSKSFNRPPCKVYPSSQPTRNSRSMRAQSFRLPSAKPRGGSLRSGRKRISSMAGLLEPRKSSSRRNSTGCQIDSQTQRLEKKSCSKMRKWSRMPSTLTISQSMPLRATITCRSSREE